MIKMYSIFARETLTQMKFEGKLAAQAGHAYLHAWWDAEERLKYLPEGTSTWGHTDVSDYYIEVMKPYKEENDARKISLVVDTVKELQTLYDLMEPHMGATLVEDCGYTVFDKPTITALGLGPVDAEWARNSVLGKLETLTNEIHAAERD